MIAQQAVDYSSNGETMLALFYALAIIVAVVCGLIALANRLNPDRKHERMLALKASERDPIPKRYQGDEDRNLRYYLKVLGRFVYDCIFQEQARNRVR